MAGISNIAYVCVKGGGILHSLTYNHAVLRYVKYRHVTCSNVLSMQSRFELDVFRDGVLSSRSVLIMSDF